MGSSKPHQGRSAGRLACAAQRERGRVRERFKRAGGQSPMIPRYGDYHIADISKMAGGLAGGRQAIITTGGAYATMKYLVGYSGGADSQVALDLALAKYDDVEIVFIDTSLEFPETFETVEATAKYYGLEIRFLRAAKTFEEYLEDFGGMYPSWRRRWCEDRLKARPLKRYISSLSHEGLRRVEREPAGGSSQTSCASPPITVIDGIRGDESPARRKRNPMEPHRSGKWDIEHIVFTWSKTQIFGYIEVQGLPLNPLYKMGYSRVSCWFCPFTPVADNRRLGSSHPELYAKAQEWAAKYGRRFCYPVEDCEKL